MTTTNDRAATTHEQFTPKPTHVCRVCGAPARVIDYRPGPAVELKLRCEAGHYTETGADPDLRSRVLDALDLLRRVRFRASVEPDKGPAYDAWYECVDTRRAISEIPMRDLAELAEFVRAGVLVPEEP